MKVNFSKTFLLPLLHEFVGFESKYIGYVKNTFVESDEFDFPVIGVLHRFNYEDIKFPEYEEKLMSSELFVKSIDKGKDVLYIFKFPDKYLQEYLLFKDSIYSKFSSEAKQNILSFWNNMYKNKLSLINVLVKLKQILYKDDKLRQQLQNDLKVTIDVDQELGEYIDLKRELLII